MEAPCLLHKGEKKWVEGKNENHQYWLIGFLIELEEPYCIPCSCDILLKSECTNFFFSVSFSQWRPARCFLSWRSWLWQTGSLESTLAAGHGVKPRHKRFPAIFIRRGLLKTPASDNWTENLVLGLFFRSSNCSDPVRGDVQRTDKEEKQAFRELEMTGRWRWVSGEKWLQAVNACS